MSIPNQPIPAPGLVDVGEVVREHRFNSFSFRVVAICVVVVLFEGYDITAMAFALPGLASDWDIQNFSDFGPVLSVSMIGMMLGSGIFGYLGDRLGRRKVIALTCVIFGVFTGLTVLATTIDELLLYRLIAGIGLGGAAPSAIALTSEYAPIKHRSFIVTVMFSGIGLGGALPGIAAELLMADYGWESLFIIGGIFPIIVAIICLIWLPESPTLLMERGRSDEVHHILSKLDARQLANSTPAQLVAPDDEQGRTREGFAGLFRRGLTPLTLLFWIAVIGNFMTFYVVLNWTPTLFTLNDREALASLGQTTFQFGGVTGGFVVGYLLDRRGPIVMAAFMLFSAIPLAAIGLIGGAYPTAILIAEFFAGMGILGTAYGFGALAATIYPASIRSSGAGFGLGAGRLGAIVSTIAAGYLVGAGIPLSQIFMMAAIPLVLAGFSCLALALALAHRASPDQSPAANLAATD